MSLTTDTDHLVCMLCDRTTGRLTQRGRWYLCDWCLAEHDRLRQRIAALERETETLRRRLRDRERREDALCEQYGHLIAQMRRQVLDLRREADPVSTPGGDR